MTVKLWPVLAIIFGILYTSANLANTPPIDVYSTMPQLSMLRISPDGSRIAYRSLVDDQDYLVIKELATGKLIGGIGLGEINPQHAYFLGQDKVILIASTYRSIAGFRGQHDVSTAFIYDVHTKEVQQMLVPGRKIYRGQTGLGRVVGFSPEGDYAYMPAYVGDDRVDPTFNLMEVDVNNPRRLKSVKRGRHDAIDYFVDDKGDILARELYSNERNEHSVDALVDDEWVEIFSETAEVMDKSFVGLTPDRKSLVMVASPDGERNAYFAMSLTDGSLSEPLFHRTDATIEEVLTDHQRVVLGVRYSGFKPDYAFFDERITKTFQAIQKAMPENTLHIVDHTPDFAKILLLMEGKKMQDDLTDAVLHLADEQIIDRDKVCIVGWSYGGYAALAGAAFTPDLYRCAIAVNGVSDVEEMMRNERREHGYKHWVVSYWQRQLDSNAQTKDLMAEISPINHVQAIKAPILLIHSKNDNIVSIEQSKDMADALKEAKKPYRFIEIENEGHAINNSNQSRYQVLSAIAQFLDTHMDKS